MSLRFGRSGAGWFRRLGRRLPRLSIRSTRSPYFSGTRSAASTTAVAFFSVLRIAAIPGGVNGCRRTFSAYSILRLAHEVELTGPVQERSNRVKQWRVVGAGLSEVEMGNAGGRAYG